MPRKPDPFLIDDENPELTAEDIARARPAREVLPKSFFDEIARLKKKRGQRGPQKKPTKVAVTIRLDRDVVKKFKARGPGWQTRINEVLKKAAGR
jgi:uncharacterized protein (DUF4415 family)